MALIFDAMDIAHRDRTGEQILQVDGLSDAADEVLNFFSPQLASLQSERDELRAEVERLREGLNQAFSTAQVYHADEQRLRTALNALAHHFEHGWASDCDSRHAIIGRVEQFARQALNPDGTGGGR